MKFKKIKARKILNSLGNETIEVEIDTDKGKFLSSLPSGTSKSKFEKYLNIDEEVRRINMLKMRKIDLNSISDLMKLEEEHHSLLVSYALLKALAEDKKIPVWKLINKNAKRFPIIISKMIGGGKHGKYPEFQEFLVFNRTNDIERMVKNNLTFYHEIKKILSKREDFLFSRDLEGGWSIRIKNEEALNLLREISELFMDKYKIKMEIGVDIAASSFYDDEKKKYVYGDKELSRDEQISYVSELIDRFNLAYVEDPLYEEDFDGFAIITKNFGKKCLICADDLTATNTKRIEIANQYGAVNACIIKPDQVYSLNETFAFSKLAEKFKYKRIISHRSGETCDDVLSDLGFGLQVDMFKISLCTGERTVKINRLFKIKEELY
ncbi:MAG: hypothetical protein QXP04_02310, partial [Candidatus Nanoarchaeia archaeon]|nr:hypothetical protein [Candidatus Jingweiarchaeum tengchongense]